MMHIGAILSPLQGNRWFVIRYGGFGSSPVWGRPFVSQYSQARQLMPAGAELYTWQQTNWVRL